MVVQWGEIGAILAGMGAMTTIIPFVVKLLVKPAITDEIAKLERRLEERWEKHLRVDHGYGYRKRAQQGGMYYRRKEDEDG